VIRPGLCLLYSKCCEHIESRFASPIGERYTLPNQSPQISFMCAGTTDRRQAETIRRTTCIEISNSFVVGCWQVWMFTSTSTTTPADTRSQMQDKSGRH